MHYYFIFNFSKCDPCVVDIDFVIVVVVEIEVEVYIDFDLILKNLT
jgi:hypothetical protein